MRATVTPKRLVIVLLSFFVLWTGTVRAQEGLSPLISVADQAPGRVLSPGQAETLAVRVTDRDGAPLADWEIVFVAPESGASGTFMDGSAEQASFRRTYTNADGVASVTFVANEIPGVYLVDAVVEGTPAAVSFGMTNTDTVISSPPLAASDAHRAVVDHVLLGAIEDETLRLHGPVLLSPGARVASAGGGSQLFPSQPTVTDRLTWLFWVDEYPGAGYQHPTRFVLIDASTAETDFADAIVTREAWWPQVTLPDAPTATDLLPPSTTNRTVRNALRTNQGLGQDVAGAIRALAEAAAEDTCAIAISGPSEWALGNSTDAMADFFESDLQIPTANISTHVDSFGWSQECPPGKLEEFLEEAKEKGCKKLYLYIACHGNSGRGLVLGNEDDEDGFPSKDYLPYDKLGELLEPFAEADTEVCLIIDSCYSGLAIQHVQDRGVSGSIITAADRTGLMLFPLFAWSSPAHFTKALIECWRELLAQDSETTDQEAYEWVIEEQEGEYAVNGRPQFATVDPAGGVHPLDDVRVPLPCNTVPMTIRRPPQAVGEELVVELEIMFPSLARFVRRDADGNAIRETRFLKLSMAGEEITVEVHGVASTPYRSFTRDHNLKEFHGSAMIWVGDFHLEKENTQVGQGETETATLHRSPFAERRRAVPVEILPTGSNVGLPTGADWRFLPGQNTLQLTLHGQTVSTDTLQINSPLFGLAGTSLVTVTGSPCPAPPDALALLGIPETAALRLPLGNTDCTPLGDGSHCTVPQASETICGLTSTTVRLGSAEADALFTEIFPCGQGPHGLTVCASSQPPFPGDYLVVTVQTGATHPITRNQYCQIAVVLDADGRPENNFIPQPPFGNDYFGFADTAFQLLHDPTHGWRIEVVDMRNGLFAPLGSNARFVILDDELAAFIPMAELATPNPAGRVTFHCHLGDYGLSGGPWSGDYFPAPGDPLLPFGNGLPLPIRPPDVPAGGQGTNAPALERLLSLTPGH